MFQIFVYGNNRTIKAVIIGKINKVLLILYEAGCRYTGMFFAVITNVISVLFIFKKLSSTAKTRQKNKHFH